MKKSRIPTFKSLKGERACWQGHSATEFWDELTPAKLTFVTPRKRTLSVRLNGLEVKVLRDVLTRLTHARARPHVSPRRKGT